MSTSNPHDDDETVATVRTRKRGVDDETIASITKRSPRSAVSARFAIEVVVGTEKDRGSSAVIDASRPSRLLVGQSGSCDFRLADPEVSRRHVAFEVRGEHLNVIDLGSTNGTYVNGLRVNDALLAGGELVRVGTTTLRVTLVEAKATTELSSETQFGMLIGESDEMRRLYPLCERLAQSDMPVVIEGESGTGKDLLAEAIHDRSSRAKGPFVVFDCTAYPSDDVEKALFGQGEHPGYFEEAHDGTLLIDEIGELDSAVQMKLLRALEQEKIRRVGSPEWIGVNVRVLAATRRDLDQALQAGTFRDDLYFRLAVGRVELPPLRKRYGDVSALARHFWRRWKTDGSEISPMLLAKLESHTWPGNVRELHHAIAKAVGVDDAASTAVTAKPPVASSTGAAGKDAATQIDDDEKDLVEAILARDLPLPRARGELVEAFERRYVERVLAKHGGKISQAAAASGLGRRYFQLLRARQKT